LPALDDLTPAQIDKLLNALPPEVKAFVVEQRSLPVGYIPSDEVFAILNSFRDKTVECSTSGETPTDPTEFFGYVGTHYEWPAGDRSVDETTVTILRDSKAITLLGLAHAGRSDNGVELVITARILTAKGETVATSTATSMVGGLRPGEPTPFQMTVPVSPTDVDHVLWSVEAVRAERFRTAELALESTHSQPTGALEVNLLFRNRSDVSAKLPTAVLAFFDSSGRVVELDQTTVARPGESGQIEVVEPSLAGTISATSTAKADQLTDFEAWAEAH
jgi:hypothetical protein